jgi:hypothetical protein
MWATTDSVGQVRSMPIMAIVALSACTSTMVAWIGVATATVAAATLFVGFWQRINRSLPKPTKKSVKSQKSSPKAQANSELFDLMRYLFQK